jgi:SAM-dependent methyltransferase
MKLQLVPDNDAEAALLARGEVPAPFYATWMGLACSHALIAAVELGLFDRLAEGSRTASELAETVSRDVHGLTVLLEALAGFEVLAREGERFALTPTATRWLVQGSPACLTWSISLGVDIDRQLARLVPALRSRVEGFHQSGDVDCWARYLALLNGSAAYGARALVEALEFATPPRRMLDVAGGPGRYSAALCGRYPELTSDIYELPEPAREGAARLQQEGLAGRVRYHVGDVFERRWPEGEYDLVLVSHFLHCLREEQAREVVRRAAKALRPGGLLVINDVYCPDPQEPLRADAATFSLVYYATTGGRTWPPSTYASWAAAAGLAEFRWRRVSLSGVLCESTCPPDGGPGVVD